MKFKRKHSNNKKMSENKQVRYIGIVIFMTVAAAVVLYIQGRNGQAIENGILIRPDYAQEKENIKVNAEIESGGYITADLDIYPKQLSEEEVQKMFDEMYELLLKSILKDNDSLENITSDLDLCTGIRGYPADIEWSTSDYGLIDYDGKVMNDDFKAEEERYVVLTVDFKYNDYQGENTIDVIVKPKELSSEESLQRDIINNMINSEKDSRDNNEIKLPQEINNRKVSYSYASDTPSPMLAFIFGIVAVAGIIAGTRQEKQRQINIRKNQLQYDYSEVISKFSLLVGAGMTVAKAWEKIVTDYLVQIKQKQDYKRFVYDEMAETYNQLRSGITEVEAYEGFGKRCNTKEYIKFGSLLVQNVRKGTKELISLLDAEAQAAFEEHKNIVKTKGEEAGTKLLMPMVLMLIIVMVIVIAPAMMSFDL